MCQKCNYKTSHIVFAVQSSPVFEPQNRQPATADEYWSCPRVEQARSSFTLRWPNNPGGPTAKSWQPRSLSAERNENYRSSVQISPSDANRGSIGQGYSILKGGLQYSYIRKYQTPGVSALTVHCSQLHMSRAGSLFGSISGDNNSSAITGELVPCYWFQ